jgi:acyl-CoA synthetase (AMP-forming)/AMP-acid ligase II
MLSDIPPAAIVRINDESDYTDFQKDIEFLPQNQDVTFDEKRGYTVVFTAAEDGFAKGALLTQHNLLIDAAAHATTNNASSEDTICALLPLSHLFGLTIGVIAPILSHSKILIENVKNLNALEKIAVDIKLHNVTYLYTIPVLIFLLGNTPGAKENFNSLKMVTTGGCKLSDVLFNKIYRHFGFQIHEGY